MSLWYRLAFLPVLFCAATAGGDELRSGRRTLTGTEALGDWTTDAPGVRRKVTLKELAQPYDTPSANNRPKVVSRPAGAWPQAPEGFAVTEFATGLKQPRVIACAPNGDLFIAESNANQIRVLRDADGDGKPEVNEIFAGELNRPFGIAFYPLGPEPKHVYVGNTDSVIRFPYQNGDIKASGKAETIINNIPSGNESVGGGGHWTRDLEFSPDGKTLYVSVGSRSNFDDDEKENRRAMILAFDPDGKNERVFASGIRNPVGLAIHPQTGQLWTSVNERDGLGDNLVPDYITHVQEGGFYGWPWYYLGPHQDPRHAGKHPELKSQVIVPDVLLQSHMASLDLTFYDGEMFPKEYRHEAFACEHGSWNRARRVGYKVIRIPMQDGKATGEYEDFLVGFVTKEGDVWGRPVGVAVAKDGSLMVTDDASGTVWRVAYQAKK
jgi:glucose/arabinose dehydrogenase